ncbi:hypothetical protein RIF29_01898 [Crotalaria pallida]|uniref:Uncharacterized protein n=1 Tax=Crotalaria pallida TaxID=3830 RepID=A0AAN9P8Q4_CROPI
MFKFAPAKEGSHISREGEHESVLKIKRPPSQHSPKDESGKNSSAMSFPLEPNDLPAIPIRNTIRGKMPFYSKTIYGMLGEEDAISLKEEKYCSSPLPRLKRATTKRQSHGTHQIKGKAKLEDQDMRSLHKGHQHKAKEDRTKKIHKSNDT